MKTLKERLYRRFGQLSGMQNLGGREIPGSGLLGAGQANQGGTANLDLVSRFPLTLQADGTVQDSIIIAAKAIDNSATVHASISWIEI